MPVTFSNFCDHIKQQRLLMNKYFKYNVKHRGKISALETKAVRAIKFRRSLVKK